MALLKKKSKYILSFEYDTAQYGLKLTSINITPESPFKNAVQHWRSWAITLNALTSAYPLTLNKLQGKKRSD